LEAVTVVVVLVVVVQVDPVVVVAVMEVVVLVRPDKVVLVVAEPDKTMPLEAVEVPEQVVVMAVIIHRIKVVVVRGALAYNHLLQVLLLITLVVVVVMVQVQMMDFQAGQVVLVAVETAVPVTIMAGTQVQRIQEAVADLAIQVGQADLV
jgi:hypothetical protein